MKVSAVRCRGCGDTIYSRARHDFHWCSCESVAVDGGFEYLKLSAKTEADFEHLQIEVDATKRQLFDDWNSSADKFGVIKPEPEPAA